MVSIPRLASAVAAVALALSSATAARAAVMSTFDVNDEGWRVSGDAQGSSNLPTYSPTAGITTGYVFAKDDVAGGVWYWQAPAKFLGDQSAAYGQSLDFSLRQVITGSPAPFDSEDVILNGPAGLRLCFDTPANPTADWTAYSIPLVASAGWRVSSLTGPVATEAQFQAALTNLTSLFIRGEFQTGPDTGSLDNVTLVPEPSSAAALALLLAAARRRRRQAPLP